MGRGLPLWSVAPFATMLLAVAVMPFVAPVQWRSNRNKAIVSALLGLPVAIGVAVHDPGAVAHAAREYVGFIVLLATLFVVSGGVVVRGALPGTPAVNTAMLALGAALASVAGTTGASMLLARPLLRANAARTEKTHLFVFFIFVVANSGGLLTPLGDPPLYLGYLRGVPFLWTFRLVGLWLVANGALVALFYVWDRVAFRREDAALRAADRAATASPLRLAGKRNLLWLAAAIAILLAGGRLGLHPLAVAAAMALVAVASWATTPAALREENGFSLEPLLEVAAVFAGIFATMIPALAVLGAHGAGLGLTAEWQFFWAPGLLSSVLDNAPTYLAFASVAASQVGVDPVDLAPLVADPVGARLLAAISAGSVLMGAYSYIGNGPNFMVRAMAEEAGVTMPGFFRYMLWAAVVLGPLHLALTWIFFT